MESAKIHFIGIGGIGMSGVAQVLLHSGYHVQGSDLHENAETEKLSKLGAEIMKGHDAQNLRDADVIVYSSAISWGNPELKEAREKGLTILSRAEMLAELMRKKQSIAISGAHGKTTTSAMITTMMIKDSRFDPTAVIGGRLRSISGNAKMGTDEWFVAEADESDGSFLKMLPLVAVITNLDYEHLVHYGSYEKLEQAFVDFANHVPFDGAVILCVDNPEAAAIQDRINKKVVTYGFSEEADVKAKNLNVSARGSDFEVIAFGKPFCRIKLAVPGRHNVLNALAAAAVGMEIKMSGAEIAKGLESFTGIDRRMEWKGKESDIQVYDDYAHHPTEISATVDAIRTLLPTGGKIRVVFQPHRFTRLKDLWDSFLSCFDSIDDLVLLPVYAASENPIKGVDSTALEAALAKKGKVPVRLAGTLDEAARMIRRDAKAGDIILTMGAGDVTKAASMVLAECAQKRAAGGNG